jgi:hypothetical protein
VDEGRFGAYTRPALTFDATILVLLDCRFFKDGYGSSIGVAFCKVCVESSGCYCKRVWCMG